MGDFENFPILMCIKPLKTEFGNCNKLVITSNNFTIGRSLQNSVVIPCIAISRNHCTLKVTPNEEWILEDNSTFGIEINGQKLGRSVSKKLNHGDIISLEPSGDFVYKFLCESLEEYEIPNKRIKLEPKSPDRNNILNDVKIKFEESQNYEIRHINDKIQNVKDMQTASLILKRHLELDMQRKIKQSEKELINQIEKLKGEKYEVEKQKEHLIAERNINIAIIRKEMQEKIDDILSQVEKHRQTEAELLKENNLLKEKLNTEREEFLSELYKENSSKQHMLEKLEHKVREQEEKFLKEKQELEVALKNEVEQLRLTKEKELQELADLKQQREEELRCELESMKENLQKQLDKSEQQKLKMKQDLSKQLEKMKKLSDLEQANIERLTKERVEIHKILKETQTNAQKSLEELQQRVTDRETELAALAADRIQKQAEQSCEVIVNLQEQLETVKNQLQSVESEKDCLLKNLNATKSLGEGTSKQNTLAQMGELIETELQCSICAELFVEATTLNCSHTFCQYCITAWKKKKNNCPICRAKITSQCRSLVLDTFIEKIVQNLTEDMKAKRQDILKHRADCESEQARLNNAQSRRRSDLSDSSDCSDSQEINEGSGEGEGENSDGDTPDTDGYFHWDLNGSTLDNSELYTDSSGESIPADEFIVAHSAGSGISGRTTGTRRRRHVEGVPGAYYGGYGYCYRCGARGHWVNGCPYR